MYKVVHPRSRIHVRVSRSFEAWTRYLCTRRTNGSLVFYVTRVFDNLVALLVLFIEFAFYVVHGPNVLTKKYY